MKVILSCLLLFLAAVAQALSATGSRLLSIWEDVEDQKAYTQFLGDLESTNPALAKYLVFYPVANHYLQFTGRGYQISHATPKQENLKLEHLGERNYDHIIFFPIKSKGTNTNARMQQNGVAKSNRTVIQVSDPT